MSTLEIVTGTADEWTPTAVQAHPESWVETNEKNTWYFLGVLPPIYFPGGFAVSEPQDHDRRTGEAIYLCIVTVHSYPKRYFARYLTIREAGPAALELRSALGFASGATYKAGLDGSQPIG